MKTPRPKTTGNWLVERLRESIISGELAAGSIIRQEELAEAHGVSRMPVRQALEVLVAEGWVEQRPHRGAVVVPLDPDDALELFAIRAALEELAIRRSFPRLGPQQTQDIVAAWEALRTAKAAEVSAAHRNLHLALYAAAGPRLLRLISQQLDATVRYLHFESSALHVSDADNSEHEQLVAAALARDVETGVRIIHSHVSGGGSGIAESLRKREVVQ